MIFQAAPRPGRQPQPSTERGCSTIIEYFTCTCVGDTSSTMQHCYGRGATSVLRVNAVCASMLRIRDGMN
eukprot:6202222-Pleurochrysis_carterae.AAC.7